MKDLDTIALEWNLHRITKSRNSISPRGRPTLLFHNPQQFHTKDYIHSASSGDIDRWISLIPIPEVTSDKDVYDLASIVLEEKQWNKPQDVITARELYIQLRITILNLLRRPS
ncbi:unnamed protein product [Ceutorhynchus assimilis]|uniref:Uncharacterized protein n=1 Tax=Ceutorhynchus assimilis TaxID=467358 RepID=A0A9N9MLW9_9CUCU|nr:unnamed protein product [Ceutorhynchus assimilis]